MNRTNLWFGVQRSSNTPLDILPWRTWSMMWCLFGYSAPLDYYQLNEEDEVEVRLASLEKDCLIPKNTFIPNLFDEN
ncbi:hypothetical protein MKZ38_003267 [Zalerion maritima]|uniref:Uncharacterized protein n=1 Tax=Zalerion maritima TaxID=339359 RepID=A0AAD5RUN2_9PEZI|nr:hypothetical protein MKZ38_003267 [Zalerion maritima]